MEGSSQDKTCSKIKVKTNTHRETDTLDGMCAKDIGPKITEDKTRQRHKDKNNTRVTFFIFWEQALEIHRLLKRNCLSNINTLRRQEQTHRDRCRKTDKDGQRHWKQTQTDRNTHERERQRYDTH
jgi:hypothetical protein